MNNKRELLKLFTLLLFGILACYHSYQSIYTEIGCNKCHGEIGTGDGLSSNALVDSRGYPIIPRDFTSGVYTLQVLMSLKIYREFLEDQSLQIVEIEREIAEVQGSKKLPTDAKQEVTTRLREEIEYIQSQEKERSDRIYLPLDSYRGSTNLESNTINLNIE